MDAMRVSLRLGAEHVYCIYRRTQAEAPARAEEIHHAERGRRRVPLAHQPGRDPGRRRESRARHALHPHGAGRARRLRPPAAGPGRGQRVRDRIATCVVFAIGTNANPILGQTSKLKLDKRGYIATDENLATSIAGVFAGGDIVTGAATVIEAMGAGRRPRAR